MRKMTFALWILFSFVESIFTLTNATNRDLYGAYRQNNFLSTKLLRSVSSSKILMDSVINVNSKETDRDIIVYNPSGTVNYTIQSYKTSSSWTNGEKEIYSYDSNNNVNLLLVQSWDDVNNVWSDDYRLEYTYDGNNNLLSESASSWDGSSWSNYRIVKYTYNANNLLIADTTYNTQKYSLVEYTYDTNNNITSITESRWNSTNLIWDLFLKINNVYSGNLLTTSTEYSWSSSWINRYLYNVSYDSNTNPIEIIIQSWDGSAWGLKSRSQYTYNSSYLLSNISTLDDYRSIYLKVLNMSIPYKNMMISETNTRETSTDVWSQSSVENYYYNLNTNKLNNSVQDAVKIKLEQGNIIVSGMNPTDVVSVFTLDGICVASQTYSVSNFIKLPHKGIYIITAKGRSEKIIY